MELIYKDGLGKLYSVFIDFEDLDKIGKYNWNITNPINNQTQYVRGKPGSMHRYIMKHYCDIDGYEIDHINRNGLDNRKENLRLATSQENKRNRRNFGNVEFIGVYKFRNKYEVSIKPNEGTDQICLGVFEDKIKAAEIYDICALKYFKLNDYPHIVPPTSQYSENQLFRF